MIDNHRMPHIHTEPGQHDHTVSAFIIRADTAEPKLLLHRHKKLGVLLQPGGHVELDETPWQAVRHEVAEETGYEFAQLKVLQPMVRIKSLASAALHPVPVVLNTHNFDPDGEHKHTDIAFAFMAQSGPVGAPAQGESADISWLSLEELRGLPETQIYENVRQIGEFVLTDVLELWVPVDVSELDS